MVAEDFSGGGKIFDPAGLCALCEGRPNRAISLNANGAVWRDVRGLDRLSLLPGCKTVVL